MSLPGLVVEQLTVAKSRFRPHTHDEFVLSVNDRSVLVERVRLDRLRFDVGADSVTSYNPQQVQSSVTDTADGRPWKCTSIYAPPTAVEALTGRTGLEFSGPIIDAPRLAEGIRRAAAATSRDGALEWAAWCVGEAFASHAGPVRAKREAPVLVAAARRHLANHLHGPVSLDELSAHLGANRDTLVRSFVRETGVPPYAWHLQLRLGEGRRRLRSGAAIAEVAAALGFVDQAHFHRYYREAYGRTPRMDARLG